MSDALPDAPLVLVVEDDPAIASLVCAALDSRGLRRRVCATAAEAVAAAAELAPQVILLDLGLPDADGIEVVRRVRTWSDDLPILVVSARAEDADKIGGLDAGADDYLVKPFSVGELLARVRVALRRVSHGAPAEAAAFENGALSIDYAAGVVRVGGAEPHLTPMEYRLLVLLARNADKVLIHRCLLEHAWGPGQVGDLASLRVIMASLRKKIGPELIQTHVGVGYRMVRAE